MIPFKVNNKHLVNIFGTTQRSGKQAAPYVDMLRNINTYLSFNQNSPAYADGFTNSECGIICAVHSENLIRFSIRDKYSNEIKSTFQVNSFEIVKDEDDGLYYVKATKADGTVVYEKELQSYISSMNEYVSLGIYSPTRSFVFINEPILLNLLLRLDTLSSGATESQKDAFAISHIMYPSDVNNAAEEYSRNAERTANYEMEELLLVNAKAKPEFTWSLVPHGYIKKLLQECGFNYDFKNSSGEVIPKSAPTISITYVDFIGQRTISTYLGQSMQGKLVEYNGELYWENFRIAFPER